MPLLCTTFVVALVSLAPTLTTPTSSAHAGTIYKSVDKDGNIVFTDQPLEGAKTHSGGEPEATAANPNGDELAEGPDSTVDSFELPDGSLSLAPEPKNPPKSDYKESKALTTDLPVSVVEILTPITNATLHDPIGNIWVELQSYPTPMKKNGLVAELWMNDRLVASGKRPLLSLPSPERGSHVLIVKLVDEKGNLRLQSEPTYLHVKHRVNAQ